MTNTGKPNGYGDCPTASFWIDESGSKSTATSSCFVMAGLKTRHADDLQRQIKSVREKHGHWKELKFGRLNANTYPIFTSAVDVLESSDVHLCATVVGRAGRNPFKGREHWRGHVDIVSQLVIGNLNRGEIATVFMDGITTPPNVSLGAAVRRSVHSRLHARVIPEAVSLDSQSNDLLQLADLIAGCIFFSRTTIGKPNRNEHKLRVARRLAAAFDISDFNDVRNKRVNISTLKPALRSVSAPRRVS